MGRSKSGEAIGPARRTVEAIAALVTFRQDAKRRGDLLEWRRARAVAGYIEGVRVVDLAEQADVTRGSVNRWLQWYEADGVGGLVTKKPPGAAPRLSPEQQAELSAIVEAGPQAAGFTTGMWTGVLVGQVIRERFGVTYHNHHVPRLLHRLGFSVQRPRKRLARADKEAQATWLNQLVDKYAGRKVFLVVDNAPAHWLDDEGKAWLKANPDKIELHRLPPYSPEYMPVEGVWKVTRKLTTHNRFFHTTEERDAALKATFRRFQREPSLIERHVVRFRG